jgi:Family of unknown function (DUF5681)
MRKRVRKPRVRYTVGYARPPTSSQFQPGQSGNAKGRPKGVRNASSMARDALERRIDVKVNGRRKKMTVRKAAYLRLAERAVAGDGKALDYLLSLESEEHSPGPDQAGTDRSAAKDLAILQDFFDRRRVSLPQEHDGEQHGPGKRERGHNEIAQTCGPFADRANNQSCSG